MRSKTSHQHRAALFENELKSDGRLFILELKRGNIKQHVEYEVLGHASFRKLYKQLVTLQVTGELNSCWKHS